MSFSKCTFEAYLPRLTELTQCPDSTDAVKHVRSAQYLRVFAHSNALVAFDTPQRAPVSQAPADTSQRAQRFHFFIAKLLVRPERTRPANLHIVLNTRTTFEVLCMYYTGWNLEGVCAVR